VRFRMQNKTAEFDCTKAPLTSHTRLLSMTDTLLRTPPTKADESMLLSVKLMMPVKAEETLLLVTSALLKVWPTPHI
jgi:hypothetical protein